MSLVTLDERNAPVASNDPPVSISSASTVLHSGNTSVTSHKQTAEDIDDADISKHEMTTYTKVQSTLTQYAALHPRLVLQLCMCVTMHYHFKYYCLVISKTMHYLTAALY